MLAPNYVIFGPQIFILSFLLFKIHFLLLNAYPILFLKMRERFSIDNILLNSLTYAVSSQ